MIGDSNLVILKKEGREILGKIIRKEKKID